MMKKITLLFLLGLFSYSSWAQSVLLEEDFQTFNSAGDPPPMGWTTINGDGSDVDPFYTDQGVFTTGAWEFVNFQPPFTAAIYSNSSVVSNAAVSNWLISPQVNVLNSSFVEFEIIGLAASTFELRYATSIAGATPVASDFTNLIGTYNTTQAFTQYTEDLAAVANQSVYFAVVDISNGGDIAGLRNFRILNVNATDVRINTVNLVNGSTKRTDYLVANFDYISLSCLPAPGTTTAVSLEVENIGTMPFSTFTAGFVVDSFGVGAPTATQTVNLANPLAPGQTETFTFMVPADLSNGDPFYTLDTWVSLAGDISPLDDTFDLAFVFTPETYDFVANGDYQEDFEQADFNAQQFILSTAWAWTFIDNNQDGFVFAVSAANPGAPNSGQFQLSNPWNSDMVTAPDDYAYSPCLDLLAGTGYQVSVSAACGEDNNGNIFPERFRMLYNSTPTVAGNTVIDAFEVTESSYNEFTSSFVVPTSGTYHLGLHCNSDEDQFFLNIDDVEITTFDNAPTSAFSVSSFDEVVGTTFTNFCDGAITVTNNSTGVIDETVIDWGDGTVESFTSNSLGHTYAALGTYTITVTASNVLGGTPATESFEYAQTPTPNADFTIAQNGTDDVEVEFLSPGGLPCFTYSWIYGDGGTGTGSSSSNIYTANGTFNVILLVEGPNGQSASSSQEVVITGIGGVGIEELNFVNGIVVFPNPVNNVLNVSFELSTAQNISIELVSIDGRIVSNSAKNTSVVNETINTSGFASGIYILNITRDEGIFTRNVVVK